MPGRSVYGVVLVLALAGLYACWSGVSLIWDGAYQLAVMLSEQRAYFFEGRFHSHFLWQPVLWLSRVTDDVDVLQGVYGLPFCLAPAGGLLLSWWVVRRERSELIVWAVFGIAAATLPGQIFIINDSIFQQHLFWPVFLGALVPLTLGQVVVLAVVGIFQFSHAIGVGLFVGTAGVLFVVALADRENRRKLLFRAGLFLLLAAAAVGKIFLYPDSYGQTEATWEFAMARWNKGVAGAPLQGLRFMWAAGFLVFAHAILRRFGRPRLAAAAGGAALLLAATGGLVWVQWASDDRLWAGALDFRRWVVPLTVPFFALACFERCLPKRNDESDNAVQAFRVPIAYLLAGLFATVMVIQSALWMRLSGRLMAEVEAYPGRLIPHDSFPWADDTPLAHWGTVAYMIVEQGKRPEKLIVNEDGLSLLLDKRPMVPYSYFDLRKPQPGAGGWYDFRPLVDAVRRSEMNGSDVPAPR